MRLEGLVNGSKSEGPEDAMGVTKQIQRHRVWVGLEGRRWGPEEVTASRVLEVDVGEVGAWAGSCQNNMYPEFSPLL